MKQLQVDHGGWVDSMQEVLVQIFLCNVILQRVILSTELWNNADLFSELTPARLVEFCGEIVGIVTVMVCDLWHATLTCYCCYYLLDSLSTLGWFFIGTL